jgi:predicted Zn-dependent protease
MKNLVAILVGVAAGIAFAAAAHVAWAHDAATFYPNTWSPPTVTYHFTPSVPTEWQASVDFGADQWSNVNGSTFDYVHGTDVADFDPTVCNTSGVNGIHRGAIDGASGTLGVTRTCFSTSTHHFIAMQVLFDSAENFNVGSGNPSGSQPDLESVATHELGHATGFSGHFTEPALCAFNSSQQTMCSTHLSGSTWQRSLADHDQHTFAAAYPGPFTTTTTIAGGTTTTRPCTKNCATSTTSGGSTTTTTGGSTTTTTGGGTTTTRPCTKSCGSTTTQPGGSTTTRKPK